MINELLYCYLVEEWEFDSGKKERGRGCNTAQKLSIQRLKHFGKLQPAIPYSSATCDCCPLGAS